MTFPAAAGIDAGQRYLDVGLPSGTVFRTANRPEAFPALLARLKREGVERVVLEAIGSYTHALVQALAAAGFAVGLVNPRRIKAFGVAEGKRARPTGWTPASSRASLIACATPSALCPTPTRSRLRRCPRAGASSPK